jgi:hypothetical protein
LNQFPSRFGLRGLVPVKAAVKQVQGIECDGRNRSLLPRGLFLRSPGVQVARRDNFCALFPIQTMRD